jgi:hypothetical protein
VVYHLVNVEVEKQGRQSHIHQIWLGLCYQVGSAPPNALCRTKLNCSLSIFISAADTWLHVTTKSVEFFKLQGLDYAENFYGSVEENVYIDDDCFTGLDFEPAYDEISNSTMVSSCAATIGGVSTGSTVVPDTIELLGGVHERYTIYNYSEFAYVGKTSKKYFYDRNSFDFITNAFAVSTTCKSIAPDCSMPVNDGLLYTYNISDIPFNCKSYSAFSGNLGINPLAVSYFTDASGADNNVTRTISNNVHFAIALAVPSLRTTTEAESTKVGLKSVIFLACNTTVHEAEYAFVNGTVRSFHTRPTNASVGRVFMLPVAFTDAGHRKFTFDAQVAAASIYDFQDFVDAISLSYSKMIAALAYPALEHTRTPIEQLRTRMIVAKVPKAPLFVLVGTNLLFAVAAGMLAWEALRASRHGAPWQMKLRLGIPALVAQLLESGSTARRPVETTEEMFAEFSHAEDCKNTGRVCLDESAYGGWELREFKNIPDQSPGESSAKTKAREGVIEIS